MFGAILKTTNSSFQKGKTFCHSIYVQKVMKLLAFIFEQSSYTFLYFQYCTDLLKLIFHFLTCKGISIFTLKIVSEYDQEIPQSQTADNPMAPRGRATQPS